MQSYIHLVVEWAVKRLNYLVPYKFARCNLVKILLNFGCESVIEDVLKVLAQEVCNKNSYIFGEEFPFFCAGNFLVSGRGDFSLFQGKSGIFPLCAFHVLLNHISSLLGDG